jgi:hypothetical protein
MICFRASYHGDSRYAIISATLHSEAAMTITNNTKVFLAVLALVFALQVIFDIQADYDQGKAFLLRLFTSALIAGAATFFWNQFRPKKN